MKSLAQESCGTVRAKQHGQEPAARVCLLGASFDTGNLGVNALAESSVKCVLNRWPDAQVVLLGNSREESEYHLELAGKDVVLRNVPVRFCKNLFLPHHFLVLAFYTLLVRLVPLESTRRFVSRRNRVMKVLLETDAFIDIAGGDSFSDIYGLRRLTLGFLTRLLPLMLRKDFILFPQTYGPFNKAISRCMAHYVLKRARKVYSRDREGLMCVKGLLAGTIPDGKVRFAPDVAFLLDSRKPPELGLGDFEQVRTPESVVVGLNVSGLIYYGGYTNRNEFGLKIDYRMLVNRIVDHLLRQERSLVVLVPHVVPCSYDGNVENDLSACLDVHDGFAKSHPGRLFVARGRYDQCQIKYIIGLCDFFIGTRMHSCIAALSQCIPAIGLAYSRKFKGVFETAGVARLVLDLREIDEDHVIAVIDEVFKGRCTITEHLRGQIPSVKQQVLNLLEDTGS
ncbi:MAG: polysaccharide pyruvyl transferase family protein [Sedimentisphaerales bacterium]|nr:polysaccharide pyruvyl transferase family protein [Sedimentisphaerales bacterium]